MAMPLAPINLIPWGGQAITTAEDNTFIWQSDGSQAAYYIEYGENEIGATINNTGWQVSSQSMHLFAANILVNAKNYRWRVKIRNAKGQESIFSEWAIFKTGLAPGLIITFPANDLDIVNTIPTYQHQYNNSSGYFQVAYQYRLFTGTTWDDFDALTAAQQESYTWDELEALETGSVLWDSGRVDSKATSVEQPSEYMEILQYWYKVQATIWDNADNEVVSDIRTFGLLLESVPKKPIITASSDGANGRNIISIINPTPDVGQIGAVYNKLYRRRGDGLWELVQDNITNGIGYDSACRSGVMEEYSASAVGTNDIEGGKSASAYAVCQITAHWFTNLTTGETIQLKLEPKWGRMDSERDREEITDMDGRYLSVNYGSKRFYRGSFQALLKRPTDGSNWQEYCEEIRDVLDPDDYSPILFRSMHGDSYEINIYDFKISQNDRTQQTRLISFNFVEIKIPASENDGVYFSRTQPLKGYWLVDPVTNEGYRIYGEPEWGDMMSERDRSEVVGLGEEMPEVSYGNRRGIRGGFTGLLLRSDEMPLSEQVIKLRNLADAKHKKPLLFHMASGDIFLVDTYGFSFELFDRLDQARRVSFEFIEIGGI